MKKQKSITLKAPAKVNLCLAVTYPPQDGYHLLKSVFQELTLHDDVRVTVRGIDDCVDLPGAACTQLGTTVALDCGDIPVTTQDNLAFKAIEAFEAALGRMVVEFDEALEIHVDKRIPAGGGLGGGSSDAAAVLKACCELHGVDTLDERVVSAAQELGADVAFFLHGGCALMDRRGDRLVRHLPEFPLPIVLMGEDQGISTARIYRDFDTVPPTVPDAEELAAALEVFPSWGASREEKLKLARLCRNNLEPATFEALPRLKERVERAQADPDVLHALVTGSGATSYAICADEGAALRFEKRAAAYCDWTCVC